MLLLILGIFIILMIIIVLNLDDEEIIAIFVGILFVLSVVVMVSLIINVDKIINGRIIQQKIDMYEEENEQIESQLAILVEQYMNYESGIYGELKGDSAITLISLYPELKADALVSQQIEIYVQNNNKIKELKEELIDVSVARWWVYFGR